MKFSIGDVVISVAGHDVGSIYVVVGESQDRILLSDGNIKKLEDPKKKNPAHVILMTKGDPQVEKMITEQTGPFYRPGKTYNAFIRKLIKAAASQTNNN
ncbi:MAG: hypothetical protein E7312_03145 [Clostridiales bacterium]|nr:hypothetical protein [Clostridiales bacterium]